jgi:transglutaminase-like putative cysteine protease
VINRLLKLHNNATSMYFNFTYTKGITNIETTLDEILEHRKECQDFALVLLQLLRTAGIPSRYKRLHMSQ